MQLTLNQSVKLKHQVKSEITPVTPLSQRMLEATKSAWPTYSYVTLKREISALPHDQLIHILNEVVLAIGATNQPILEINRLADLIPLKKLEAAVRINHPQYRGALLEAQKTLKEAQIFLKMNQIYSTELHEEIQSALISSLDWLEKNLANVNIFPMIGTLMAILTPLVGPIIAVTCALAAFITTESLKFILPLIKFCPATLPSAQNWTKKLGKEGFLDLKSRTHILNTMAKSLDASSTKPHVLLIGKSGVGKTETVKAFVQSINHGKYPHLKEKKIFYINTLDLVKTESDSKTNKTLENIAKAMEKHKNNIILIFDDIDLAHEKTEAPSFKDELKDFLNSEEDPFPCVIGITREEGYLHNLKEKNSVFNRRFHHISLTNTNPTDTAFILNNIFLKNAPEILLERPDTLAILVKKTREAFGEDAAEPLTSSLILSECINRIYEIQRSSTELKLENLQGEISYLHSIDSLSFHSNHEPLIALEEQEETLIQALNQETKQRNEVSQKQELLSKIKFEIYSTIAKVSSICKKNLSQASKKDLSTLILYKHFVAPALRKDILDKSQALGIKSTITEDLINQVIEKEIEEQNKHASTLKAK